MARKMMSKEVTKTTVKIAKMVTDENGAPKAEQLPEVVLIGNVTLEAAQKAVSKQFDYPVTVFGVHAETEVYEMEVADFIKYATLKMAETEAATQPETPSAEQSA